MNIKVVFEDNKMGEIDKAQLDEMIAMNNVRMFMRSDGWAMVGIAEMRGSGGGVYAGPDRRGLYGLTDGITYKIAV